MTALAGRNVNETRDERNIVEADARFVVGEPRRRVSTAMAELGIVN